jgi:hypothetical protein
MRNPICNYRTLSLVKRAVGSIVSTRVRVKISIELNAADRLATFFNKPRKVRLRLRTMIVSLSIVANRGKLRLVLHVEPAA